MNIAVCEDTKTERDSLCLHIERYFRERSCPVEISVYENGAAFLAVFTPEKYQAVFLDIYMPGLTGVEIAKKIRETDDVCAIVFTTVSKEHALDGYGVRAIHYLLKPVQYDELKTALDTCHDLFAESMRYIEVLANRLTVKVLLRDILFIEVYQNACLLHTVRGDVKAYCTLAEIEEKLGGEPFLRCHRTHIVNMNYIDDIQGDEFLLKDGWRAPIRKAGKGAVKQAWSDYLFALIIGKP